MKFGDYEQDLGPLEQLLEDATVSEILINGHENIYVERWGQQLEQTEVRFESEEQLMEIIQMIVTPLGRHVDESSPIVDARLPDGSRVNVVIPPISLTGPTVTIRKFSKQPMKIDDLIQFGTLSPEMVEFLKACIVARLNVVISGGTGSGKTTILNVLSSFIPAHERIITVENAAEIQLQHKHVVVLESRPANMEGKGEVSIRDLVINTLRMRPDRIITGEVRSGEALDLFQAMNTGYDGSMFTLHANSPRDAIARLEVMATMAGMDIPLLTIREQLASAVDVIVQQMRLRDGSRKIVSITELVGMQGNAITFSDIFEFVETDFQDGKIIGHFTPTGIKPTFSRLRDERLTFSDDFFTPKDA